MMEALTDIPRQLLYQELLSSYLHSGGESALNVAYEFGRNGLRNGMRIREVTEAHQRALDEELRNAENCTVMQSEMSKAACRFLSETLSPFEVSRQCDHQPNEVLIRLYDVFENEAKRIAHRLHDESAQILAVVYLELAEIAKGSSGATAQRIRGVVVHLDEVTAQLRSLSHELRPIILDQLGIMPALRALVDGVRKRSQLVVTVSGNTEGRLAAEIETVIYRAVQEALTNACRHAEASHVDVQVWRDVQQLCCVVSDNGRGFKLCGSGTTLSQGLGLIGIKERAVALGGICDIYSQPGIGTKLQVTIPL